jgi:hypothetical protein
VEINSKNQRRYTMEGIRFRETPEQARRNQRALINDKIARCQSLSAGDYDFLRREAAVAAEELAAKFLADQEGGAI